MSLRILVYVKDARVRSRKIKIPSLVDPPSEFLSAREKGEKKISARTKISRDPRGSINSLIIGTREILQTLFHVRRDEKEINGRQLFRKKKSVLALNCNVRVHVTRYDDPLIISFFFFFFKLVPRAAVPFNFLRHAGLDTVNST